MVSLTTDEEAAQKNNGELADKEKRNGHGDSSEHAGRRLDQIKFGVDELVISGLSGKFPESSNIKEFEENLFHGVDMVTDDGRRWTPGLWGLPARSGKLKNLDKFDAFYFGVHPKQANFMDPQLRLLHELTYEAIVDAGVHPSSIRGTNTGVFIGTSESESAQIWMDDPENLNGYGLLGCQKSMFSNRISFSFDLRGPSFTLDTACSSSLLALEKAVTSIRLGECDAAIVGGVHLCLQPKGSLQFHRLQMLSPEGKCRSFDSRGNGYVRSEAACVIFIQKKDLALRFYASIIHAKTSTDGYKELGVTFPNGQRQAELLHSIYQEAGVDPQEIGYVEAHGTGTSVGDPQELSAVASVFCGSSRRSPLLVGSVKSNMGHSEPSSGLCSVAKVLLAMQRGVIPANLHYKSPNPDIPALVDGRIKVVSENTPWEGGFVGINSFGFGGCNVHVILQSNPKKSPGALAEFVPLIVPYSGRTRQAVEFALRQLGWENEEEESAKPIPDQEAIALLQEISVKGPMSGHPYRGFAIIKNDGRLIDLEVKDLSQSKSTTNVKNLNKGERPPVWFICSGMGTQWPGMGRDLMDLPIFAKSIMNSVTTLKNHPHGIDLTKVLSNMDDFDGQSFQENIVNAFVSVIAVQMALIDILKALGIHPDGIIGHSVGELVASYADDCFTAEQTIVAACVRGSTTKAAMTGPAGAMAAVGLTWEEAKLKCPPGVYPACHNSRDSVTISGPAELITSFVEQLKAEGIFAKEVNSAGLAFHSKYIEPVAPALRKTMEEIIPEPKARSSRWISSSIPEPNWGSDLAKTSSAAYHANNLVSPVLFHEALQYVPENAVVIEIGPHCLLQGILKRSLPHCTHLSLMNKNYPDNLVYMLNNIGKMYNLGLSPDLRTLYRKMKFPVSVGASSISPLIQWDHQNSWNVAHHENQKGSDKTNGETTMEVSLKTESDQFYSGHKIDGRIIFPATGYLFLIWKAFAQIQGQPFDQVPIILEQISLKRATVLPKNGSPAKFIISILKGSGEFQIQESGLVVVSGVVRSPNLDNEFVPLHTPKKKSENIINGHTVDDLEDFPIRIPLSSEDCYKELRLRGYDYSGKFQGIHKTDPEEGWAQLKWQGNWISFLDTILQCVILSKPIRALYLPTFFDKVAIDPQAFLQSLKNLPWTETGESGSSSSVKPNISDQQFDDDDDNDNDQYPYDNDPTCCKIVPVYYQDHLQIVTCEGIQFQRCSAGMAPKKGGNSASSLKLEKYKFTPYFDNNDNSLEIRDSFHVEDCLRACAEILTENSFESIFKITEIVQDNFDHSIVQLVQEILLGQPLRLCTSTVIKMFQTENEEGIEKQKTLENLGVSIKSVENIQIDKSIDIPETDINREDLIILPQSLSFLLPTIAKTMKSNGFLILNCSSKDEEICPAVIENLENNFNVVLVALKKCTNSIQSNKFYMFRKSPILSLPISENISDQNGKMLNHSNNNNNSVVTLNLKRKSKQNGHKYDHSFNYSWVDDLKAAMKDAKDESHRIYLVSSGTPDCPSGVLGLILSLRWEPGGKGIRCFFNQNSSSCDSKQGQLNFDDPDEELTKILRRDLLINVFDSTAKTWGTFCFYPLAKAGTETTEVENYKVVEHAYVNVESRGDLSSLQWFESPLKYHEPKSDLCDVYYAPLNFRDVMLASGKLPLDSLPNNIGLKDCVLGLEFSGKMRSTGRRVTGLLPAQALATTVVPIESTLFPVPDDWSLAQAATIPAAYSTAFYSLIIRGKLKAGESILIHAGSGSVGQAAISVALHLNCTVFTTVGSLEKRKFLKKTFPSLTDSCFANSRDSSFLQHIMTETKGRGVDVVLNSLAEEKLLASTKCLAQHGRFLEIGKLDLFRNSSLGMALLLKNVSVHGILLDSLTNDSEDQNEVRRLMEEGMKNGVVRPISSTIFGDTREEIEQAFRFMAGGKHVGKVLIEIRKEEEEKKDEPQNKIVKAIPRTYFDPLKSYIIVGGLGGFGLELCLWLIERGASSLVLVSRSGVKSGYQSMCLRKFRKLGAKVVLFSSNDVDLSTEEWSQKLLENTLNHFKGKEIGGIFNLAMVSADSLMDKQSPEKFEMAAKPKVEATLALDGSSRKMAPLLDYFVCFSSAYSGRGGPALSSYAYANSAMERICEQRQKDGLPGLAIQWGPIGDVGILQGLESDKQVSGTIPQRISSCLKTLDTLLPESKGGNATVSSLILPEKRSRKSEEALDCKSSLLEKVAHILGMQVKDVESQNPGTKLHEVGMDSLMGVEIKQLIEMSTDLVLSQNDMIELTFGKLKELKVVRGDFSEETSTANDNDNDDKGKVDEKVTLETEEKETIQKDNQGSLDKNLCEKTVEDISELEIPIPPNLPTKFYQHYKKLSQLEIKSVLLYFIGVLSVLAIGFLVLISLIVRQGVKLYMRMFLNTNKIKLFERPFDELMAANPRTTNLVYAIRLQGVPFKSKMLKLLDQRIHNYKTNICLDRPTSPSDSEYRPYENLQWRIVKGRFFHYWKKDSYFSSANHLVFESCDRDLEKEAVRISSFYHNYDWSEDDERKRPRWELRVLTPNYPLNTPTESKEFLIVFVIHHSYGDANSALQILQFALCDQRLPSSVMQEQVNGSNISHNSTEMEKISTHDDENLSYFQKMSKLMLLSQKILLRGHNLALELGRIFEGCTRIKQTDNNKIDNLQRRLESPIRCSLTRFSLSQMKSMRSKSTGKSVPVSTVVLTVFSKVYERLYATAGKQCPDSIVTTTPYAIFPYRRLGLVNNIAGSISFIPTHIQDSQERMNVIQEQTDLSSRRENLMAVFDFSTLASMFTLQLNKLFFNNTRSVDLLYTSVPATIPKTLTFFGGYKIKDFFGCTSPVGRALGTLASTIDSTNDSVTLCFAANEHDALAITKDFFQLFFQFFQEELDNLAQESL